MFLHGIGAQLQVMMMMKKTKQNKKMMMMFESHKEGEKQDERPSKSGIFLSCNLETEFLRLDQALVAFCFLKFWSHCINTVMEKAVFQWITDSSHLEVQSGVVLTFSPVSPCPPHRRTSLQTNK